MNEETNSNYYWKQSVQSVAGFATSQVGTVPSSSNNTFDRSLEFAPESACPIVHLDVSAISLRKLEPNRHYYSSSVIEKTLTISRRLSVNSGVNTSVELNWHRYFGANWKRWVDLGRCTLNWVQNPSQINYFSLICFCSPDSLTVFGRYRRLTKRHSDNVWIPYAPQYEF